MITESLHGNNRLVRKTILRMYPGIFFANLTTNVALMVDTLLAGAFLGQQAIAAIAIALPAVGIFQALIQSVIRGSTIKMAVHAGRGDQQKLNGTFTLGLLVTAILGLLFMLVCLTLADTLANVFGGAKNPEVAAQAALYLRSTSVCVLMGSLNSFMSRVFNLCGRQKEMTVAAVMALAGNFAFSLLYLAMLPPQFAIMGLGIGTWSAGLLAFGFYIFSALRVKLPLKLSLKDVCLRDLPEIASLGLPTTGNSLLDNAVAGLVNNLIVAGFGGDTTALAVYTAVGSAVSFCDNALHSVEAVMAPLLSVLYGSRDRNGIVRTVKEGLKLDMLVIFVWGTILLLALPFFARLYDMVGNPHFRTGVIIGLLTTPLWALIYIFTQVYESTEKAGFGLLFSTLSDSVIYPIMLSLLLPLLQYNGLWISYNLCAVPFFLALYLIYAAKHKSLRLSWDSVLRLDESIRDNVPMLDISIQANNTDVTGISQRIHHFLLEEGAGKRTAYMTSLCLEELAADFVEHTMQETRDKAERTIMDIKLFSDSDSLRVVIRNAASRYNPLDFTLDDQTFAKVGVKLVQKVSRRIDYTYVYGLNIVTIDIDK